MHVSHEQLRNYYLQFEYRGFSRNLDSIRSLYYRAANGPLCLRGHSWIRGTCLYRTLLLHETSFRSYRLHLKRVDPYKLISKIGLKFAIETIFLSSNLIVTEEHE